MDMILFLVLVMFFANSRSFMKVKCLVSAFVFLYRIVHTVKVSVHKNLKIKHCYFDSVLPV